MTLTETRQEPEPAITVVLTSCGRPDLLARTLDSFLQFNTCPVRDFIVMEDGVAPASLSSDERYQSRGVRFLATGRRMGQMAAIDMAYGYVRTEYIFHCEDDWEFYAPGFMERSLTVLRRSPEVLQVWLRALDDTNNLPIMDHVFLADTVPYRFIRPGYHSEEWGTWHGFSLNPGLRRLREYQLIGSFCSQNPQGTKKAWEVERDLSELYLKHGFLAAILADADGKGYVRHIGWGRRVGDPAEDTHA
jgi:hypothetical protein